MGSLLITTPADKVEDPPATSGSPAPKFTEPIPSHTDPPVLKAVELTQRGRILVVDDNAINLKVCKEEVMTCTSESSSPHKPSR